MGERPRKSLLMMKILGFGQAETRRIPFGDFSRKVDTPSQINWAPQDDAMYDQVCHEINRLGEGPCAYCGSLPTW